MFCPQCTVEYRAGFTRCSDCDVELVDHLPPDEPSQPESETEFVVLRRYRSGVEAELAKSVLASAGIDSVIRTNDAASWLRTWGHIAVEVLVRSEDAAEADEILDAGDG
jgi:hypothetical protein